MAYTSTTVIIIIIIIIIIIVYYAIKGSTNTYKEDSKKIKHNTEYKLYKTYTT